MDYFKDELNFGLPVIPIKKVYKDIILAQKGLRSLSDRINNAEKTFVIEPVIANPGSLLLIDDAVGSGASLNIIAKKIRKVMPQYKDNEMIGLALVGSFKGFDVISQV